MARRPKPPVVIDESQPRKDKYTGKFKRINRRPLQTYTLAETRRQMNAVEQLLLQLVPANKIIANAAQIGCSRHRVQKLIARVQDLWAEQDKKQRHVAKSEQIRRIQECLREARGWNRTTGVRDGKTNHHAVIRYEEFLARLQGTYAPIEIDINVQYTEALLSVIVHQEPEELMRIVEEEKARDRLVQAFTQEHPEVARELAPVLVESQSA